MNIYQDLEDSLYKVLIGLFPDWRIIFAYTNGPEPMTPYVVIDIKKLKQVGNEYSSTLVDIGFDVDDVPTTYVSIDMLAQVRFEVVGKYDQNTTTSEMAEQLQFLLRSQKGYDLQEQNRLARHGQITYRRMPLKRETDTYMLYQVEATYAYTASSTDEQDYIIATGLNGVYHDAGREPDHVINTHLEINYPTP